jgi:hypothetical protein
VHAPATEASLYASPGGHLEAECMHGLQCSAPAFRLNIAVEIAKILAWKVRNDRVDSSSRKQSPMTGRQSRATRAAIN